jgi:hypothetical protein
MEQVTGEKCSRRLVTNKSIFSNKKLIHQTSMYFYGGVKC